MEASRSQSGRGTGRCPGCQERDRRIVDLQEQNRQLRERLETLERSGKRQAAPFSKGKPTSNPRKPGRKAGQKHGRHGHRPVPAPEQIDEVYEARLPSSCPCCGGSVHESHVDHQYQVEIPRRPIHRQFNVHIGHCAGCGKRVQGRHELQTSDALGAARSQLGPNVQAALVMLNKSAGLSYGKIQRVMESLLGIAVTRGGSARAVLRAARRCRSIYLHLKNTMQRQPAVTLDETGWRIGGLPAWLHVLVSETLTCYVVDRHRDAQVAEDILGWKYAGVMIHDGWSPYDKFHFAEHQTCLAHLLRRCSEMLETATRGAVLFPSQIKALLQQALQLRDRYQAGDIRPHGLAVARGRLDSRLDQLLRWPRGNLSNERLACHLLRHRDQVLTFLHRPEERIDATNWRAEQAIRPAVVNRKVWGGNRTNAGAQAQSILMSVWQTCLQQGRDALACISQTLRGQPPPNLPT